MIINILFAGTGGQGVLSSAAMLSFSAVRQGLFVSQSEVHGMAQRGGSVTAEVRIGDAPLMSTLIPEGELDLIISMEPLEGLRHAASLTDNGHMVTATGTVNNFAGYPDEFVIMDALQKLLHCEYFSLEQELRQRSIASRNGNMFLVGVASAYIPVVSISAYEYGIRKVFGLKGERSVAENTAAFSEGHRVGENLQTTIEV